LYWCETSPLALREEHTLRFFENRALGGNIYTERENVARGFRKLKNRKFQNLYSWQVLVLQSKQRGFDHGTCSMHRESKKGI
jgi:hypothetical protein